jgi:hypothetical protein
VELPGLCANDAYNFQNCRVSATRQPCGCPNAATFYNTADNLEYFGFVQTQIGEASRTKHLPAVLPGVPGELAACGHAPKPTDLLDLAEREEVAQYEKLK